MDTPVLPVPANIEQKIGNLVRRSNQSYLDVERSLDWAQGVDRKLFPKREDCCWLFGTPFWEVLSSAQRCGLAWLEMGRDISMFIWLEQTLPPLYVGYVNRHGRALLPAVRDYLMLFAKEEIVHTLMFRRYMELTDLPGFAPPAGLHTFFVDQLPQLPPSHGVLFTYLLETVAEIGAMDATDSTTTDRLTRSMVVAHHGEEARHIAFGRWIVESHLSTCTLRELDQLRTMVESFMTRLIAQYTYNEELRCHASPEITLPASDADSLSQIRTSVNNRRLNQKRFRPLFRWLGRVGLIAPSYTWNGSSSS